MKRRQPKLVAIEHPGHNITTVYVLDTRNRRSRRLRRAARLYRQGDARGAVRLITGLEWHMIDPLEGYC